MNRFAIRALFVAAALAGFAAQTTQAQVDVNVSIGGFYDELAPYGNWVDCSYGQCWVPARVAADWQPYSNGQWIYTEYGWTWVSNDPWGSSPYHYGTWASISGHGWSWVPGTVWAPAWVTWSYSNNYVGWAPLPPTVVFGGSGYIGRPVVVSHTQYVFVPTNRFVGRNVATVRLPAQQSAQIFRETRHVTGFAVTGGIVRNTALPIKTIEHASGAQIETRNIQTAGTAPRAVPANSHLAVVAPAREVKAAVAARPQAASKSSEASPREPPAKAPADREPESAKAPKTHEAPPAQVRRQSAEPPAHEAKAPPAARPKAVPPQPEPSRDEKHAKAPAGHEPGGAKPAKVAKGPDAPAMESHHAAAEAPEAHSQEPPRQAEASRPAEHAAKPKPQPQKAKPVETDKKPDGEKP